MHKRREKTLTSSIAGPPIKIKDGVETGRFAKKTEFAGPLDATTQSTINRMEDELAEEEQWALSHEGRPRIEIYDELFEEIILKDKKYGPILRKIKAVYTYEIQSQSKVELRELQEAHSNLMLDHQDLYRRFSQLEQDNKVYKKSLHFRNLQVFELEEMIARKEREIEEMSSEKISEFYQVPEDIVQSINKLRVDIEERAPALEGYTSQTTIEMDRLQQRIKELETELRISKLREKDLYSKFLELKLVPPSERVMMALNSRPSTAPSLEQSQYTRRKPNPIVTITRVRSRSIDIVKGLSTRKSHTPEPK